MSADYQIVQVDHPGQAAWGIIGQGISDYNQQQAGEGSKGQVLCYALQGPDEVIVGGVIGIIYWDWLSIDLLWVKAELRGRGFGQRLLALVEDEARRRGATHAHLDTFSFQAPEFYKKLGYRVFGELPNFPAGHTRYYFTKEL
ncbi:MAG TPA: GNAT family N-acetyltransferase [Anaerolineaceae bacterium]|nr:GNAT family N-acetyltransferase [Anaerolineaceae bacterium]HQH85774.1 GNAT family N-acetyltransferase [Anaerolineaceae bacterium]HQN43211.1 GNAT family N-acetyltransferase [Anaerolineaceae bacterium]